MNKVICISAILFILTIILVKLTRIIVTQQIGNGTPSFFSTKRFSSKSRFVEMFGDPEDPSSECEVCKLGDRCDVVTGNTPERARKEYYGLGIDWIKSDNVLPGAMHLEKAKEQLTDAGKAVARIAKPGWLLMVCIAGSPNTIGNTAFVDREVAFNQQINGIDPRDENPIFLQTVLGLLKPRLTSGLNAALKCILNKSTLSATEVPFPSRGLQDEFAAFVQQVDKSRFAIQNTGQQMYFLCDIFTLFWSTIA